MASKLDIQTFTLGDWQTNCYVVSPRGSKRCWIIDAGYMPGRMIDAIQQQGLEPELLVLTHGHLDHIAGVEDIRRVWPALPIVIHEAERDFLTEPVLNLSAFLALDFTAPPADRTVVHGEVLTLDDLRFEIRHTPGHSPGNICLYQPDNQAAFVGDTLFHDSIGRYDFPTSDGRALMRSIRDQLLTLPDATSVYPGHGPSTTIGRERAENPFIA